MTRPVVLIPVRPSGVRILRPIVGWALSAKRAALHRWVGRAHVSVYTKPGQGDRFFVKIEIPLDPSIQDESDAALRAYSMALRAADDRDGDP